MCTFTLSIRRVDDEEHPTILGPMGPISSVERLLCDVEWPHLPRVGEVVTVGGSLMLECVVSAVHHKEGAVSVDLGNLQISEWDAEDLALNGWERRTMPPGYSGD